MVKWLVATFVECFDATAASFLHIDKIITRPV